MLITLSQLLQEVAVLSTKWLHDTYISILDYLCKYRIAGRLHALLSDSNNYRPSNMHYIELMLFRNTKNPPVIGDYLWHSTKEELRGWG